jgi:hypothetical protein
VATANDLRVRKLGWGPLDDPAADEAVMPLASNTAPSQTGGGKASEPDDGKASEPDEDDDGDEPKGK